jgi:hypothetical protein
MLPQMQRLNFLALRTLLLKQIKGLSPICFCLMFLNHNSLAQNYDPILKAFSRAEYSKGKKLLQKILEKKPGDPAALFFMGQYFFDAFCPEYDLDSAYSYAQKAAVIFQQLKPEDAKRIELNSVNGHEMTLLKSRIEEKAFLQADSLGTEAAFNTFIQKFPNSEQTQTAILKRDKIAFQAALKTNTYTSFAEFLDKYPKSIYAQEALEKYESTLFFSLTAAKTLQQYRNFIQKYPQSPYIEQAVAAVYDLTTHTNSLESLSDIIRLYPNSTYSQKALYRLAYCYPNEINRFINHPSFRHIKRLIEIDSLALTGFWGENNKFGFIDSKAKVLIEPKFESLNKDYLCQGLNQRFITTEKENLWAIFDKTGKAISEFEFESVESEHFGQILVSKNGKYGLYHLGGFWTVPNQFQNLKVVSKSAVIFQEGTKYGLISHTGQVLVQARFDEIEFDDNVFFFRSNEKCSYLSEKRLFESYKPHKPIQIEVSFDECRKNWGCVMLEKSGKKNVFDPQSEKAIISNALFCLPTRQGWLVKTIDRWTLHQPNGKMIGKRGYDSLVLGEGLIAFKTTGNWGLADSLLNPIFDAQYDSIILTAYQTAILIKGKERFAYYKGYRPLAIPDFVSLKIRAFGDSASQVFLVAKLKNGKTGLWNMANSKLLAPIYDDIIFTPLNFCFIVRNGTTRGLIDVGGKWILPLSFQGLIYLKNGWFATYRNNQFGLCRPQSQQFIQPQYSTQPQFYNDSLFVVKKQKLALFDGKKNLGNFEDFDEVQYWNDTSALVRQANKWKIYDFKTSRFDSEYFDKFEFFDSDSDEILIKTFRSSGFGILSNLKGRVLVEEFTGIKQLDASGSMLFLAEKHIPQAGIYILLYCNKTGQILRKQVISDPNFEKYTCLD